MLPCKEELAHFNLRHLCPALKDSVNHFPAIPATPQEPHSIQEKQQLGCCPHFVETSNAKGALRDINSKALSSLRIWKRKVFTPNESWLSASYPSMGITVSVVILTSAYFCSFLAKLHRWACGSCDHINCWPKNEDSGMPEAIWLNTKTTIFSAAPTVANNLSYLLSMALRIASHFLFANNRCVDEALPGVCTRARCVVALATQNSTLSWTKIPWGTGRKEPCQTWRPAKGVACPVSPQQSGKSYP